MKNFRDEYINIDNISVSVTQEVLDLVNIKNETKTDFQIYLQSRTVVISMKWGSYKSLDIEHFSVLVKKLYLNSRIIGQTYECHNRRQTW